MSKEKYYKWEKASKDNLPDYGEEICIRLDGESLYTGCLFDERQEGASDALNAFLITGLSFLYFENEFYRIEWLKELSPSDIVEKDWISVKDDLPEIVPNENGGCSDEVLVYIVTNERINHTGSQRQVAYYTKDGWCYQYGEIMFPDDMKGITHWGPLPLPPKTN